MSELLALGISHKTAPLELRERLALTEGRAVGRARRAPRRASRSVEAAAVSTCNRTELYLRRLRPGRGRERWRSARSRAQAGIRPTELIESLYSLPRRSRPPGTSSGRRRARLDDPRCAVAVDYGHVRADRPRDGSLRSYLAGREVPVLPDGSRDVTAQVAVDAVAAACDGVVLRQREALTALGVTAERPSLQLAGTDPAAYTVALERSTRAADLLAPGGLGDFYWVVSGVGGLSPSLG